MEAALTNSGGLREDLPFAPRPNAPEQPGEITYGEAFAVLPFGNATVIETVTGAQLRAALLNGLQPGVQHRDRDRSLPAGRGPRHRVPLQRHDAGDRQPVARRPNGPAPVTPIGDADTVRLVTNDFMFTGGDGYTALAGGTDVLQTGDVLLDLFAEYITANSPVSAAVEGRIRKG